MTSEQEAYDELRCYTLSLGDPSFIHQHVVDAFTAQHATHQTKPIAVAFALAGLYLHLEKRFSGKQVQRAHTKLAQHKRPWPTFPLPLERGSITIADVIAVPAGTAREEAIHAWCACVWKAFHETHPAVADLLRQYGFDV
jgi:hypothetical protein